MHHWVFDGSSGRVTFSNHTFKKINNNMEKAGWKNEYQCIRGHVTRTIHRDDGVTPMFLTCPVCGQNASSRMGRVQPLGFVPTYEWIKPTQEQIEDEITKFLMKLTAEGDRVSAVRKAGIREGFLSHYRQGGLMFRKIEK